MNKEMNKKAAHICWEFDFDPQTYLYLVVKNITAFFMMQYYLLIHKRVLDNINKIISLEVRITL